MTTQARKIGSFPGGIHPEQHKSESNGAAISQAQLPEYLIIPLQQHIGAPIKPLVEVGDRVLKGQKIADAEAFVTAPIHASSSGIVVGIEDRPVMHPSQISGRCIIIQVDGKESWVKTNPVANYLDESADDLRTLIRNAGITGMGGAGFPTSVKLNPPGNAKIEQLILNAVECEPYITADDRLIRERAENIITGLQIAAHIIQPVEILIGIEDNKPEAIRELQLAAKGTNIEVLVVPTKYPSGGEKQIIQMLTGKEVPSGKLPADVGVVCQNTGTIYAIYNAIINGEPLISRITTLTGKALDKPCNLEVLIGTPVKELLDQTGINHTKLSRLIMGGPMMGFTLHSSDIPIIKSSNCILAASLENIPEEPLEQACIRCGTCTDVCPMSLLPQQLYWFAKSGEPEKAKHYNLMDCIECGACSYVCPSNIPLVQYFRYSKGEIRLQQIEHEKSDQARLRFEARSARIDAEIAEKEAKRQARAEAIAARAAAKAASGEHDEEAEKALQDKLKVLKAVSSQASKKYKAAVKAFKEADEAGQDNAKELKVLADEAKAEADIAKAAVRDAKSGVLETASKEPAASDSQATETAEDDSGAKKKKLADKMKALKTATATTKKQLKEVTEAFQNAEKAGTGDLETMQARIDKLQKKHDVASAALADAVTAFKEAE